MNTFVKLLQATALAVAIIGAPQAMAARADAPSGAPQRTVRFADLDLATSQGATELYRRIERAARFVCNDVAYNWDERRALNWLKCFNDTVDHAVMQVNRPTLLAVHRQKSKSATG
jgi:UrcA family protein